MSLTWLAFGLAVWLAGATAAALLAGALWTGGILRSGMRTIATRAATHGEPHPAGHDGIPLFRPSDLVLE
jgi:hypothetical protein